MRETVPQISVVIATHNRVDLLPRAVNSVLQQDYDNCELIVVDDASSDDTGDCVRGLDESRIRYIRCDVNGGAARARNVGILAARGEYVAFLDDDDLFLPGFLRATADVLESASEQVGLAWCGVRFVTGRSAEDTVSEEIWQPRFKSREHAYLSFLRSRRVGTSCGLTVRRQSILDVGMFDDSLKCAEDTDLLIRMIRSYDFVVVPRVLIQMHRHEGPRLTVYNSGMAEAYAQIMRKHQDTLETYPRLGSSLNYKMGWLYYHGGNREAARKHMTAALRQNPLNVKAWMMWLTFEVLGKRGKDVHRRVSELRRRLWQ